MNSKRDLSGAPLIHAGVLTALTMSGTAVAADAEDVDAVSTAGELVSSVQGTLEVMWNSFVNHLPYLGLGVLALFGTWVASKVMGGLSHKLVSLFGVRRAMEDALTRILVGVVWIVGVMLSAMVVFPGLQPADALAALGAGSVAIGFAFKDIFENFFAGIMMLTKMPFRRGDLIEVEGQQGRVEEISLRETFLRKLDGELILIPNATLFKNATTVKTDKDIRRVTVACGVGYDDNLEDAVALVQETVEKCETVLNDQPVQIFANGFGASSMDFEVTWWTGSRQLAVRESRHEVICKVKRALDEAGFDIPFPNRTHSFAESLKVELQNNSDQGQAPTVA